MKKRNALLSIVAFVILTGAKFWIDKTLLYSSPLLPGLYLDWLDASSTGILGAALVGLALEWRRRTRVELTNIAELNHVVRNNLQVIVGMEHVRGPAKEVMDAVAKIDAILQQLYPGVTGSLR